MRTFTFIHADEIALNVAKTGHTDQKPCDTKPKLMLCREDFIEQII